MQIHANQRFVAQNNLGFIKKEGVQLSWRPGAAGAARAQLVCGFWQLRGV